MKKTYVDIRNARTEDQIATMQKIIDAGVDPFAEDHLKTYSKFEIIRKTEFWTFVKVEWPYKGTRSHIMAISKEYHEDPWSLGPIEISDLLTCFGEIIHQQKIQGGGLCLRFGSTLHSGATVKHLHVHLIEPNVRDKNYQPVTFYIGGQKTKKK